METNREFVESLHPVFESLFGKDGYFLSFMGRAVALMFFFSLAYWLFRLFVRTFFWGRRGDEEQHEDEEQREDEDGEDSDYD